MNEQTSNKSPVDQANQRKSLRSPLLVLKVKVDDGRKFFFGYAKNISRSGMFIATANPREPGSTFQVDIPFPEPLKRTVRCTCEVVWQRQFKKKSSHEPGMGLKFIDLPEEDADSIDGWVKSQAK
jgi:uncharacterized protein (TIGR02266 family)